MLKAQGNSDYTLSQTTRVSSSGWPDTREIKVIKIIHYLEFTIIHKDERSKIQFALP